VVGGRLKASTTRFYAYATAYLVKEGMWFTLAATMVISGKKPHHVLERLLTRVEKLVTVHLLVAKPIEGQRLHVYAAPGGEAGRARRVYGVYERRFGVDTSYRVIRKVWAWTRSKSPSLRAFLFTTRRPPLQLLGSRQGPGENRGCEGRQMSETREEA
jgi:hypothetical protein